MQKKQHEKVVKSKVAAQKWLWWSDNGKTFNNNNSGKFVSPIHKFTWLLKILPLSDHHSHFWAATFDFTTFSCCFFFTVWLFFYVDFTSFCNLTNLCFVAGG